MPRYPINLRIESHKCVIFQVIFLNLYVNVDKCKSFNLIKLHFLKIYIILVKDIYIKEIYIFYHVTFSETILCDYKMN